MASQGNKQDLERKKGDAHLVELITCNMSILNIQQTATLLLNKKLRARHAHGCRITWYSSQLGN